MGVLSEFGRRISFAVRAGRRGFRISGSGFQVALSFVLAARLLATRTEAQPATIAPVFHSSFHAASEAAAVDQSLVLLIFGAEWCGPCKLLKSKTLTAPEFLQQEAALHVAEVDIDANQAMARDFAIEAVPTLILLSADGKIIARQTGFLQAADLLAWLKTGRDRAAAGQWEGTAPGAQFDDILKKAATGDLGANEIQRLVDMLGDADPANREQAGKILLGQREKAVPPLIEAVSNAYLGERIGASELLQRLAPGLMPVDPWQSPADLSNAVAGLRTWWASTDRLPEAAAPSTNALPPNSVKSALEALSGDDPVRRTEAMTTLVQAGVGALPALREAIQHAERSSDQHALGLLEDVFWTVLVPDAVEEQSGGVRNALARGKSSERQAATERLGGLGHGALGVLVELTGDSDPLVVESAIRALSRLSGGDAVPALAALLASADSNLRMTAAQALGHTKNPAAVKPLLTATRDPDEVVACTAIAALEENQAREAPAYNRTTRTLPGDISDGLKHCLGDPRWRVRAAAAEAAGKLGAGTLDEELRGLLGDSDGFVVKSALTALNALGSRPQPAQLVSLSKRLPSLEGDTVEMLLQIETDETVKTVTDLFNSGGTDARVAILNAFLRRGFYDAGANDERWQPMLTQAITAPDARERRAAAEVLARRSTALAAKMIEPLLSDSDSETRQTAVGVVLKIMAEANGGSTGRRALFVPTFNSSTATAGNKSPVTAERTAAWHAALLRNAGAAPELAVAAAVFVTGNGKTDLAMLLAALANTNGASSPDPLNEKDESLAVQAVVPNLSLPAGRRVLDNLLTSPVRFALAARQSKQCKSEVADYLLDPARFKSAVEPASGAALAEALELLAGYDYGENQGWTLWSATVRTKAVAKALLDSTNAAWRAAGVLSLGMHQDHWQDPDVFEKAAADPSPWVRASAVRALALSLKSRTLREQHLGPLLADTNLEVAAVAAVALLEPETRQAAGLEQELNQFQFESARGGRMQATTQYDDRPLAVLEGKPVFLAAAKKWVASDVGDYASQIFALLLAQYGDFSGLDLMVKGLPALEAHNFNQSATYPFLAAVTLSHDNKYLPALKQMAAAQSQDYALRKILQAMKGMSGPDSRQLRLDINKKLRTPGDTSATPDY